jgi:LysM repeat protein
MRGEGRTAPTRVQGLRALRSGLFPLATLSLVVAAGCQRVGVHAPEPVAPRPGMTAVPVVQPGEATAERPAERAARGQLPRVEVTPGLDPIIHSPSANHPDLEDRVAFWVDHWTGRGAGTFQAYLERMAIWEGWVEVELEARGLPQSLKYLPIVESGYHEIVVSRAGATGMWQLMPGTARELGLSVGTVVDDRRDPVAATRAALDYLERMHGMFGSWFLALAAYNAGPGRIGQIVRPSAGDGPLDDTHYVSFRPRMPAETRDFVPRFLAAARLARDPEGHGFERPEPRMALAWDEVVLPDATSFDVVAWAAGVEEAEVVALNRQYLRGFTPPGETRSVRIPAGTADRFHQAYALVPPTDRVSFMEHLVARGETLGGISARYGVRLADLQSANGNVDPRRLQVGQRLVVPVAGSGGGARSWMALTADEVTAMAAAGEVPAPGAAIAEVAVNGAALNGVLNGGPSDEGAAPPASPTGTGGDEAEAAPAEAPAPPATLHRVASGENLSVLARR